MNYHDSRWCNNDRYHLDSHFSFLKPLLEDFKFISILKYIQLMNVLIHIWLQYGYTPPHLNHLRKDPNFKGDFTNRSRGPYAEFNYITQKVVLTPKRTRERFVVAAQVNMPS